MIISFKVPARENLFRPVDALPLGVFRFFFGFLLCIEFLALSRETFPYYYVEPLFHFTYPLFDVLGLKPLSKPFLWLIFHAMQVSTVGIMLGLFTRLSFIVFTPTFGYFFFMESAPYTNHYYLIFLLSLLMCCGHSGSIFSLDSLINKNARREQVDYWELCLLRFQICIVFFFGGLAKVNEDWLIRAAPLYLNVVKHLSFLGYPFQEQWVAVVLSWGGMLMDFGLAILLFTNRWHKLGFLCLCLFNGMNIFFLGLGIKTFPYLMLASYIVFLPGPVVRESIARRLNEQFLKYVSILWIGREKRKVSNEDTRIKGSLWILGFVIIYTSLQILIPLRHLLYKRNLQWTHEGSNFSWRMMADRHETNLSMTLEDPRTKDVYIVFPEKLLNDKQLTIMGHTPYMLFQYIQFLKQLTKQKTDIQNPIIRADVQVSLNGKPFQYMVDPTCNLSEVNYSPFRDVKWILPLEKK